jgi:hypothetical protein
MDLREILAVKEDAISKGSQPTANCSVGDAERKEVT